MVRKIRYVYRDICMYVCIHIYMDVCVCVCKCWWQHCALQPSSSSNHWRRRGCDGAAAGLQTSCCVHALIVKNGGKLVDAHRWFGPEQNHAESRTWTASESHLSGSLTCWFWALAPLCDVTESSDTLAPGVVPASSEASCKSLSYSGRLQPEG